MAERTLTQTKLAARLGVTEATISRWRTSGKLPPPASGPKQRGIFWTEAAIAAWEAAGFTANIESWRGDLKTVDFARKCMDEVCRTDGVHQTAKDLARAAMKLLANPLVPLKARVGIARSLLNECDWSTGLGEMDDGDRERANKVRYLLGQLHRKHGGRTDE